MAGTAQGMSLYNSRYTWSMDVLTLKNNNTSLVPTTAPTIPIVESATSAMI